MIGKFAVLGAGTIGASWAALFATTGRPVHVYDPSPEAPERVRSAVSGASMALCALGHDAPDLGCLSFTSDPAEAVAGAEFIQESIPEILAVKHALYQTIEPHLMPGALIGTSTSGLKLSDLQEGFFEPSQLFIAHPFNPPHLIPLVELIGNEDTGRDVLQRGRALYESLGKTCIELNKEVPGHVANRLQAAIWREALHLAREGVASLQDIDRAVVAGPGLRWAALGPSSLFHLGGGAGGIEGFCDHIGPAVETWWNDLGAPDLDAESVALLRQGLPSPESDETQALASRRDDLILAYLRAQKG